ncbi:MAG: MarR family transcriptional regulator [Pseudomonadota bacterium]
MDQAPNTEDLKQLLCFNIYSLNRAFGRYYQAAFSETGLTYPKFVILMALDAGGPMSVSALSTRAGVESNTLSPLLKKMAEFGALTRQRAEDDERRVEVAITPKGEEMLKRARNVVEQGFQELGLNPKQITDTIEFLEATHARVENAEPPKLSFDGIK